MAWGLSTVAKVGTGSDSTVGGDSIVILVLIAIDFTADIAAVTDKFGKAHALRQVANDLSVLAVTLGSSSR